MSEKNSLSCYWCQKSSHFFYFKAKEKLFPKSDTLKHVSFPYFHKVLFCWYYFHITYYYFHISTAILTKLAFYILLKIPVEMCSMIAKNNSICIFFKTKFLHKNNNCIRLIHITA